MQMMVANEMKWFRVSYQMLTSISNLLWNSNLVWWVRYEILMSEYGFNLILYVAFICVTVGVRNQVAVSFGFLTVNFNLLVY